MDRTPAEFTAHNAELSRIAHDDAFRLPAVGAGLRRHTRYARQNGVHFSPAFVVNRIVNSDMSSGQTVEKWAKELGL